MSGQEVVSGRLKGGFSGGGVERGWERCNGTVRTHRRWEVKGRCLLLLLSLLLLSSSLLLTNRGEVMLKTGKKKSERSRLKIQG